MANQENNYASLADIAKELGINKSKLSYYASLGLFSKIAIVGGMGIYDKLIVKETLYEIKMAKQQGTTLKQITDFIKNGGDKSKKKGKEKKGKSKKLPTRW